MSITSGFFDSIEGDRTYSANDLSTIYEGIVTDGVVPGVGGCLQVSSASGMKVTVSTGKCIVRNKWLKNTNNYDITIEQSDTTPRIDVIVAELDETMRVVSLKAIKGTAAASPTEPVLTENQLALAAVRVATNTTVISEVNVTDKRVFCQLMNGGGSATHWGTEKMYEFSENGINGFSEGNLEDYLWQNSGAHIWDVYTNGSHVLNIYTMLHTVHKDGTYLYGDRGMVRLPEAFKGMKFSVVSYTGYVEDTKGVVHTDLYADRKTEMVSFEKLKDGYMYMIVNPTLPKEEDDSGIPTQVAREALFRLTVLAAEEWNDISF